MDEINRELPDRSPEVPPHAEPGKVVREPRAATVHAGAQKWPVETTAPAQPSLCIHSIAQNGSEELGCGYVLGKRWKLKYLYPGLVPGV